MDLTAELAKKNFGKMDLAADLEKKTLANGQSWQRKLWLFSCTNASTLSNQRDGGVARSKCMQHAV